MRREPEPITPRLPFERGVRLGPDVSVAHDVTMPRRGMYIVSTRIPNDLRELFPSIDTDDPSTMREHVRSRHAQAGIHVHEGAGSIIAQAVQEGKPAGDEVAVPFLDLSDRTRYIKAGTRVFQLFQAKGDYLSKKEIQSGMSAGDITIDGDWRWHIIDNEVRGIELPLDTDNAKWIKPHHTPIEVDAHADGYREALDQGLLVAAPKTIEQIHWVTQTNALLHLTPNVHALVSSEVPGDGFHVNSPLLKGGETNWHIRTEVVGPTEGDMAEFVIVNFAQAA